MLQVNIVEQVVETYDSIAVSIYYSIIGIYSNSKGLAIIEAIQEVRYWTSTLRLSKAQEVDLVYSIVNF